MTPIDVVLVGVWMAAYVVIGAAPGSWFSWVVPLQVRWWLFTNWLVTAGRR